MLSRLADTVRSAAGRVYWASSRFLPHVTGKAVILMYHRVMPPAELSSTYVQPGMYVTPETFERHLRFLRAHFELLSFRNLLDKWDAGGWNESSRYCVVTFDDGWLDNYQHAYPVLRAYSVPATIFLPTDLIGSGARLWPDRLGHLLCKRGRGTRDEWNREIERAKELSDAERNDLIDAIAAEVGHAGPVTRCFVNWDEVDDMCRHGVSFGSHSATHANLTRLSAQALERELRASLEALGARAADYVPVLAYPNGDHTDVVAAAAQAAGYRAAVTTRPGLETRRPDLFRVKRIAVHEDVSRSIAGMTFHIARTARRWHS
jgi:peptidoglycan/xylan/chitin deacetylase (PgdA/CDA1 family)